MVNANGEQLVILMEKVNSAGNAFVTRQRDATGIFKAMITMIWFAHRVQLSIKSIGPLLAESKPISMSKQQQWASMDVSLLLDGSTRRQTITGLPMEIIT